MKKWLYVILLFTIFITGYIEVNASSGQLKKASIKTCNDVTYGQHSSDNHWHVAEYKDGRYYALGSAIYNNPCDSSNIITNSASNSSSNTITNSGSNSGSNTITNSGIDSSSNTITNNGSNNNSNVELDIPQQEKIKSSDNTLKEIIIDDKSFDMTDDIEYYTTKEKVIIKAITNDEKAIYEIKNNSILSIGENIISIEVKAEDGTIKNYNIKVIRERILSSDIGLKVIIDDEEVKFDNYKAIVYVGSTATNIDLDYTLNDEKSRIEMDKLDTLKTGDNELKIKVKAEDGTEQIYEITIHKYSHREGIISIIISFALLGSIGYGIYFVIKRR